MAQRYTDPWTLARMADGNCPECGLAPDTHLADNRFWVPRLCGLTKDGVADRLAQYQVDLDSPEPTGVRPRRGSWVGVDNPEPDLRPMLEATLRHERSWGLNDEEYDSAGTPEWTT